MTTTISFIIPAFVAFGLIALLIKERYNLLPKRTRANNENNQNQEAYNYQSNKYAQGKRYPDDFVDLSGGSLGI